MSGSFASNSLSSVHDVVLVHFTHFSKFGFSGQSTRFSSQMMTSVTTGSPTVTVGFCLAAFVQPHMLLLVIMALQAAQNC